MGKIKTLNEKTERGILKGKKMAEAFAKHRAKGLLATFLDESGMAEDSYAAYLATKDQAAKTLTKEEYLTHLLNDYERTFGECVALAYALGYIDCTQGSSIKDIYVPRKLMPVPSVPKHGPATAAGEGEPTRLVLPGIE